MDNVEGSHGPVVGLVLGALVYKYMNLHFFSCSTRIKAAASVSSRFGMAVKSCMSCLTAFTWYFMRLSVKVRKVHPTPFFQRDIVTKYVFVTVEHLQINALTPSVAIRQELL